MANLFGTQAPVSRTKKSRANVMDRIEQLVPTTPPSFLSRVATSWEKWDLWDLWDTWTRGWPRTLDE